MDDLSTFPIPLLEENIRAREEQLASLGSKHRDYAYLLSGMSDIWLEMSKKTRKPSDSEKAIEVARQAVDVMLPTEPDPAPILSRLDSLLFDRFRATGHKADLDEALTLSDRALRATKEHGAQWMSVRYNYNQLILERLKYYPSGAEILDDAVESSRTLINLNSQIKSNIAFSDLYRTYSACLCERGKAKGSPIDLSEGIS